MTDYQPPLPKEPGPQPDPMLHEGRRSKGWMYLIGAVIVVIVIGTLYALNPPSRQNTASQSAPPQTAGQSGAPQSPISGGRTTGAAPPEQTTGSGNAGGSSNSGGKPGNTAH